MSIPYFSLKYAYYHLSYRVLKTVIPVIMQANQHRSSPDESEGLGNRQGFHRSYAEKIEHTLHANMILENTFPFDMSNVLLKISINNTMNSVAISNKQRRLFHWMILDCSRLFHRYWQLFLL